jgi:hypothetical protein
LLLVHSGASIFLGRVKTNCDVFEQLDDQDVVGEKYAGHTGAFAVLDWGCLDGA